MNQSAMTPEKWFEVASHWYVERHQGCPWCGQANQVYKSQREKNEEYRCGSCDFLACCDHVTGKFFMGDGKNMDVRNTMLAPPCGILQAS